MNFVLLPFFFPSSSLSLVLLACVGSAFSFVCRAWQRGLGADGRVGVRLSGTRLWLGIRSLALPQGTERGCGAAARSLPGGVGTGLLVPHGEQRPPGGGERGGSEPAPHFPAFALVLRAAVRFKPEGAPRLCLVSTGVTVARASFRYSVQNAPGLVGEAGKGSGNGRDQSTSKAPAEGGSWLGAGGAILEGNSFVPQRTVRTARGSAGPAGLGPSPARACCCG